MVKLIRDRNILSIWQDESVNGTEGSTYIKQKIKTHCNVANIKKAFLKKLETVAWIDRLSSLILKIMRRQVFWVKYPGG